MRVRLTYVDRTHRPHDLRELAVNILFEGEFARAYEDGDNSSLLPTDTMKNTVYILARTLPWDSIEVFGQGIAQHFLAAVDHLTHVTIEIEQVPWRQIGAHESAFSQSGN